ncbi:MAG: pyridoxamine 5'-phosphate oxidase [Bryobacteraceae bacterium]
MVPHPPREEYERGALVEDSVDTDPIRQFDRWFEEALTSTVKEPSAMSLATVNAEGVPSVRIVLLKGVDERGFVFYTNYESRKGKEIAANPQAALAFFWPELERQVRIVGRIRKVTRQESEAYFASRPLGSRLGASVSHQSEVLPNREELETRLTEFASQYAGGAPPCPPFWGGYRLEPTEIEFWQGRRNRLHDRLRYRKGKNGRWKMERLSP